MTSQTGINKGYQKEQRIQSPMFKRLYTLAEAGKYLGRSEYSVRTLIWSGFLPVVKHGKKQWVDVQDMNSYIEKNKEVIQ